MLTLFHYRSAILALLALVVAAVYHQLSVRPTTRTETMAAQVPRSISQAIYAREQSEVSPTACALGDQSDRRCRVLAPESVVPLASLSYVTFPHS
jgi:hypothetical protein